jgi:5-methylcytosine-specific restriction protein A
MQPFVHGAEYKRVELLSFVGSKQRQSGVLWGPREPGCLICTSGGRHGKRVGYSDEVLPDGTWMYFGQGTEGDQDLANPANSKLASGTRSVLLFTTREPTTKEVAASGSYAKLFVFRGSFNVSGVDYVVPEAGPRQGNRLLRFRLIPTEESARAISYSCTEPETAASPADLRDLQRRLVAYASAPSAVRLSLTEYRNRSAAVHGYALLRARGKCEGCDHPAPFLDSRGRPFLEVHHMLRLADDGLDAPANVAALCPNCHRAAHHSRDREDLGRRIAARVAEAEHIVSVETTSSGPSVPGQVGSPGVPAARRGLA